MRDELSILRLGLRRVAEIANKQGANLTIPRHAFIDGVTDERGWNDLCNDLIGWLEDRRTNLVVSLTHLEAVIEAVIEAVVGEDSSK